MKTDPPYNTESTHVTPDAALGVVGVVVVVIVVVTVVMVMIR